MVNKLKIIVARLLVKIRIFSVSVRAGARKTSRVCSLSLKVNFERKKE
jgi:hypothetical protein